MIKFIGGYDIKTGDKLVNDAKLVFFPDTPIDILQATVGKYIHTIPVRQCTRYEIDNVIVLCHSNLGLRFYFIKNN